MSTLTSCPPRPRIVCIDDEPAIHGALIKCFKPYDVEVMPAYNGAAWHLAGRDGETEPDRDRSAHAQRRRRLRRAMPEDTTGYRQHSGDRAQRRQRPRNQARLQTLGVVAYLTKPLSFEVLVAAVRRQIDLRPLQTAVLARAAA